MDLRHVLDRMLGPECSVRRRVFQSVRWHLGKPLRDYFDAEKRVLFETVRPYTMVSYRRLSNAYELCRQANRQAIPGAFVECGVWRGGTSAIMAHVAREGSVPRITWLFDSFEGLPPPTPADGVYARGLVGKLAGPRTDAEHLLFDVLKVDRERVAIRQGWFQDTLAPARREVAGIAVLRLDGDWYESTRVCLDQLFDSVSPGGFVILDDYGYWEGCRRATDEFLAARGLRVELRHIDYSGAYFIK